MGVFTALFLASIEEANSPISFWKACSCAATVGQIYASLSRFYLEAAAFRLFSVHSIGAAEVLLLFTWEAVSAELLVMYEICHQAHEEWWLTLSQFWIGLIAYHMYGNTEDWGADQNHRRSSPVCINIMYAGSAIVCKTKYQKTMPSAPWKQNLLPHVMLWS